MMDENGVEKHRVFYKDHFSDRRVLISELIFQNVIPNGCMIRMSCYEDVGGYDPLFFVCEDYEFWTRLAKGHTFKHIGTVVYKHRLYNNITRSARLGRPQMHQRCACKILRRMLKRYSIEELFPLIEWDKIERAQGEAIAFYHIGLTLFCAKWLQRGYHLFPKEHRL